MPVTPKRPRDYGYGAALSSGLARVVIPEKVKCKICRKIRPNTAYSNKQLNDLREIIYSGGSVLITDNGRISCKLCTAGQTTELTCAVCDQTKGLEEFAKTQRRTPDEAKCILCIQKVLNTEPNVEDAEPVVDDDSSYWSVPHPTLSDFSKLDLGKGASTVKEAINASASGTEGAAGRKENTSIDHPVTNTGVWIAQDHRRGAAGSGRPSGMPQTGYGQANRNTGASQSATGSQWGDVVLRAGNPHPQPTDSASVERGSGSFAKVPGRRVPVGQHVGLHPGEQHGSTRDITYPEPKATHCLYDDDDEDEDDPSEWI